MLEAVYVHFSRPLKNSKLCDIQSKLGLKKGNMLRVCDTRWVCRYKNCEAMVNNFNAIIEYLETEINEQSDKGIAQAIGNKLIT